MSQESPSHRNIPEIRIRPKKNSVWLWHSRLRLLAHYHQHNTITTTTPHKAGARHPPPSLFVFPSRHLSPFVDAISKATTSSLLRAGSTSVDMVKPSAAWISSIKKKRPVDASAFPFNYVFRCFVLSLQTKALATALCVIYPLPCYSTLPLFFPPPTAVPAICLHPIMVACRCHNMVVCIFPPTLILCEKLSSNHKCSPSLVTHFSSYPPRPQQPHLQWLHPRGQNPWRT